MSRASIAARMRKICLALPDTREDEKWGKPHFVVGKKIFAGCGEEDGRPVFGFKLTKDRASLLVQSDGFWPSKYTGKHGWVTMDATPPVDWDLVAELVGESYRLIAPKRSLAKLED